VELASGEDAIVDIVADDTHVYWSRTGVDDAVVKIDHEGTTGRTVLISRTEGQATTLQNAYALGETPQNVYVLDRSPGGFGPGVYAVNKVGGPVLAFGNTNNGLGGLVLTGTHALWTNWAQQHIERAPITSGSNKDLEIDVPAIVSPMILVGDRLFFAFDPASAEAPTIGSVDVELSGPIEEIVIPELSGLRPVGLDHSNGIIFVSTNTTVVSFAIDTLAVDVLASTQLDVSDMHVDEDNVYWVTTAGEVFSLSNDGTEASPRVLHVSASPIVELAHSQDRLFWATDSGEVVRLTK
jgi:hypothetical protein